MGDVSFRQHVADRMEAVREPQMPLLPAALADREPPAKSNSNSKTATWDKWGIILTSTLLVIVLVVLGIGIVKRAGRKPQQIVVLPQKK